MADIRFPIFDGAGAAQYGGRWNSPGCRVIYGSLSFAGCLLEQLARTPDRQLPPDQHWLSFFIGPELVVEAITPDDVPDWAARDLVASRAYGDAWYTERRSVALIVPSLVGRPVERNVLLNQSHPDFERIAVSVPQQLEWDDRFWMNPRK